MRRNSSHTIKIAMLPKYCRDGSSSRLRLYQYAESPPFSPFRIDVFPLYGEDYISDLYERGMRNRLGVFSAYLKRLLILSTVFRYDIIWVEKEFFPRLPALVERIFGRLGVQYIVDYDDATFHDYDLSNNFAVRYFLGKKIDRVMQHASCVICGNQYIQSRAIQSGAKATDIVPTVVDTKKYSVKPPTKNSPDHQLTIGWIGSPPTEKYLSLVAKPLKKLLKSINGRLLLIGVTDKIQTQFNDVSLSILPWSEDKEAEFLAQIDIGIMPLKNEPWEKGKCGFKLLQYMAAGKPVVASPVGVNVDIVEGAECGYLAKTEAEWLLRLQVLSNDAVLRENLGRNGRRAVERRYSLEAQSPHLASVLLKYAHLATDAG